MRGRLMVGRMPLEHLVLVRIQAPQLTSVYLFRRFFGKIKMMESYIRRVSLFVLRDKKGKVLLQHRDKFTQRHPNYWAFFGGEIEKGESPKDAVIREAKEELGIDLQDLKFFKKYESQQEDGLHEKFVFVLPLTISIEDLRKKQEEGQNLGLFSFDELKDLKISNYDKVILKDLFGQ